MMEFFTILLSSLLGILAPAGFVVDRVAENALRRQINSAETLAVRIDNAPNYRFLQGKVDRVRIAGRGIALEQGIRIAALEVETDAIAVKPRSLQTGKPELEKPLDAGIRLTLTREDINQALQSPQLTEQLQNLNLDFLGAPGQLDRYDIVNPQVEFLGDNRIRFQVTLQSQQTDSQVAIKAESGIEISSGRQLQLVEPTASIDGNPLPPQLIQLLIGGISQRLDLSNLEAQGITARILHWQITDDTIEVAALVHIDPKFTAANASPEAEEN